MRREASAIAVALNDCGMWERRRVKERKTFIIPLQCTLTYAHLALLALACPLVNTTCLCNMHIKVQYAPQLVYQPCEYWAPPAAPCDVRSWSV